MIREVPEALVFFLRMRSARLSKKATINAQMREKMQNPPAVNKMHTTSFSLCNIKKKRIEFKILLPLHNCHNYLAGSAPPYLKELCVSVSSMPGRRFLHSDESTHSFAAYNIHTRSCLTYFCNLPYDASWAAI